MLTAKAYHFPTYFAKKTLTGMILTALSFFLLASAVQAEDTSKLTVEDILVIKKKLAPEHKKLGKPGPDDWLANHRERGQSFWQYLRCRPVVPSKKRKVIYIQPIGDFTKTQKEIVQKTSVFLSLYFGLPVITQKELPSKLIPAKARRKNPYTGQLQFLTSYILHDILKKQLPDDGMVIIGLTATDLWPGPGWNFVFGQASLRERVGVWSLNRYGNPDESKDAYRLYLVRALKTASHEIGHMFSMKHCIAFECNMCGSNHQEEADQHPLVLCHECVAKIIWASKVDPKERYQKLIKFCEENDMQQEKDFYTRLLKRLDD